MGKKAIKILILVIMPIIFLTGWTSKWNWNDIQSKYGTYLEKGVSCTYSLNNSSYNIKKIAVTADKNAAYIQIDSNQKVLLANSSGVTQNITINNLEFRVDSYGNYFFLSFMERYNEKKSCPSNIYLTKSVIDGVTIYELRNTQLTDSVFESWNLGATTSPDAKCHIGAEIEHSCLIKQHKDSETGVSKYLEYGYAKTNSGLKKYFMVASDSDFKDRVIDEDESDGFTILHDGYLYIIYEKFIDGIWLDGNKLESSIKIGKEYDSKYKAKYYVTSSKEEDNPGMNPGGSADTPSSSQDSQADIPGVNVNYGNICGNEGVSKVMKILGSIVSILRFLAPILIIVFGVIDYTKAVVSDDEDALEKATSSLIRRLISAVVVFLIPTLLWGLLNLLDITDGMHDLDDSQFGKCTRCLLKNECK